MAELTVDQQKALALANARMRVEQAPDGKSGSEPTMGQNFLASPVGRFIHDGPMQMLEGMAGAGADMLERVPSGLLPGLPKLPVGSGDVIRSYFDAVPEKNYLDALAAQRNRPGYAAAREEVERMSPTGSAGFADATVAPFSPSMAGLTGGALGGSWDSMNAAADQASDNLDYYRATHPVASTTAELLGGFLAGPQSGLRFTSSVLAKGMPPVNLPRLAPPGASNAIAQAAGVRAGVGGAPLAEAFRAGRAGGEQAALFQRNLRGKADPEQVLSDAKEALGQLKAQRSAAYRDGMVDVGNDRTVLSFDPVDSQLARTDNVSSYKGQDLKPRTADARAQVKAIIGNWKALDPVEYHTAEGFDALKQQIGDLRDSYPYDDPSRLVIDNAYHAVRKAVSQQAPGYSKVMASYQEASDLIDNIQRTLSLKPGKSVDTAMRKLQSVMRDGVNTNFGSRAELARKLDQNGTLMPALAGQSLSTWVPRGLMRAVAGAEGAGLPLMAVHDPQAAAAMLATLPLSSPRVMGEAAYYAGKYAGKAARVPGKIGLQLPEITPDTPPPIGLFGSGYAQLGREQKPQY